MKIKLGRILLAAVTAEVLAILALVVIVFIFGPPDPAEAQAYAERLGLWVGPIAGFVTCLLAGWWVAKILNDGHLLHGLLLGFAVALIDIALLFASGEPFMLIFAASNIGRVIAGGLGGWLASKPPSSAHSSD